MWSTEIDKNTTMKNMNKNITTSGAGSYIAPLCTVVDIRSEGVLCSSITNLGDEFDYDWGTAE